MLLALTIGPVLVEIAVLRAIGFVSAFELAPQASATSPFGVFHDLRWAFVYHESWWAFAAEIIGIVAVRSTLNAAIVTVVWPEGTPRPGFWPLLQNNLVFTTVMVVVLSPWAAVAIAASGTSLSWFLFGEMLPVLVLAMVLQRGPIISTWWTGLPPLPAIGWSVASFVVLSAGGAVVGYTPGAWVVPVAAVAGSINAWLWYRTVHASVLGRSWLRIVPVAPIIIVLVGAGLLGMGLVSSSSVNAAGRPPPPVDVPGAAGVRQAVVYVAGYDSALDGQRRNTPGLPMVPFSYRGVDSAGQPLPYRPSVTHQSLATSARLLAEQVRLVHQRTGRPVALVAQSEGTTVVRTYLDTLPHPEVDTAIQLSPLVEAGRGYFPPATAGSGWGLVTGWELRGMVGVVRWISGTHVSADEPFVRSLLDHAPLYRDRMLCPVPGVRMIGFLPTSSAAVAPPGKTFGIPVVEQIGLHASLLGRPDIQRRVVEFLNGEVPGSPPGAHYQLIRNAAATWQAPALPLAYSPPWHVGDVPDAAFGGNGCEVPPGRLMR